MSFVAKNQEYLDESLVEDHHQIGLSEELMCVKPKEGKWWHEKLHGYWW